MGELGVGVDAGQLIDAAKQIDWIHGTFLDLFGLSVRGADYVAGLESATGD